MYAKLPCGWVLVSCFLICASQSAIGQTHKHTSQDDGSQYGFSKGIHFLAGEGGATDPLKAQLARDPASVNAVDSHGHTPLHCAVHYGHNEVVAILLAAGADVNAQDKGGNTPLHAAISTDVNYAAKHEKETVQLLLDHKADINAENNNQLTPLHLAVARGNKEIVQLLLSCGADPNAGVQHGQSVLAHALLSGQPKIAEYLIANGAEVDIFSAIALGLTDRVDQLLKEDPTRLSARDPQGRSLLHWAIVCKQPGVARSLLDRGLDVTNPDKTGRTALHDAASKGQLEIGKLLLAKGAPIDARDQFGRTPLFDAVGAGQSSFAELLLTGGADVNARDSRQETPLHWAANHRNKAAVTLLLAHGADVRATGITGDTALGPAVLALDQEITALLIDHGADVNAGKPLLWALDYGMESNAVAIVGLLLDKGADPYAEKAHGWPPLHVAAARGMPDLMKCLLAHGVDVNRTNSNGETALHVANSKQMIDLLLENKANIEGHDANGNTPLGQAVLHRRNDLALALLDHGANPNATNDQGDTILDVAVGVQEIAGTTNSIVTLLLDHKATSEENDRSGRTPLIRAIEYGRFDTASLLLSRGANINAPNRQGMNVLHWAALENPDWRANFGRSKQPEPRADPKKVAQFALAHGADVNARDANGMTPLHDAVISNRHDFVEMFLANNADVNARDQEGRTPLHWAADSGNANMVKLLLSHRADIGATDQNGATPVQLAGSSGHMDVVMLLAPGASVTAPATPPSTMPGPQQLSVEQVIAFSTGKMAGYKTWFAHFAQMINLFGMPFPMDGSVMWKTPNQFHIETTAMVFGSTGKTVAIAGRDQVLWITGDGPEAVRVDLAKVSPDALDDVGLNLFLLRPSEGRRFWAEANRTFDYKVGPPMDWDGQPMYVLNGTFRESAMSGDAVKEIASASGHSTIAVGQRDGFVYAAEFEVELTEKSNPAHTLVLMRGVQFTNVTFGIEVPDNVYVYKPKPNVRVREFQAEPKKGPDLNLGPLLP